jgi:hypothetical protein
MRWGTQKWLWLATLLFVVAPEHFHLDKGFYFPIIRANEEFGKELSSPAWHVGFRGTNHNKKPQN